MALRELIGDIGGGCQSGRTFKAVQLGGPSGGCLPPDLLETRIDYEDLRATGAIMGSGGMVVVDDTTCMVDFARFSWLSQDESCGKCVINQNMVKILNCFPCRVGTRKMLGFLTRITHGQAEQTDLDRLLRLCETVRLGSLCGLGTARPTRCSPPCAISRTSTWPISWTSAARQASVSWTVDGAGPQRLGVLGRCRSARGTQRQLQTGGWYDHTHD